jgi:hypothetical protein
VDFSAYAPGAEFILDNAAKAPFPNGTAADPQTTGQVMLFRVVPLTSTDLSVVPQTLQPVTRLANPVLTRTMTLNELQGVGGPIGAVLNGMPFEGVPITEFPTLGTTEMWEVVNMTADTHPIHIHMVQFQLLNRQRVNATKYATAFAAANPVLPTSDYVPVPVTPHLQGKPVAAPANERGWKDTFQMNPGEVTRILIRFAPQDGSLAFSFDATADPGYVWHCHILEHEENDMMRPYRIVAPVAQRMAMENLVTTGTTGSTLLQAPRPNPTVSNATFHFTLTQAGSVELDLYAVTGQRLRRLAGGKFDAGQHTVAWDGKDDGGRAFAPGVYFVMLRSHGVTQTRKLMLSR